MWSEDTRRELREWLCAGYERWYVHAQRIHFRLSTAVTGNAEHASQPVGSRVRLHCGGVERLTLWTLASTRASARRRLSVAKSAMVDLAQPPVVGRRTHNKRVFLLLFLIFFDFCVARGGRDRGTGSRDQLSSHHDQFRVWWASCGSGWDHRDAACGHLRPLSVAHPPDTDTAALFNPP